MATAARPPPVNRGYYAESSQARPLTTGRPRTSTAHIHFPHIVLFRGLDRGVPQQKLYLFEIASRPPAQFRARAPLMPITA
jgi:hypothetical protein